MTKDDNKKQEEKEPFFAKASAFTKVSADKSADEGEKPEGLKKPVPEGRGSLKEFERQLEGCQKQKDEYLAGWQRARADFLNYKKEEMERIGEIIKYANEELILKFLPVLDNLELAEQKMTDDLKNSEYIKGVMQIKKQLCDFLKSQGVEEIKTIGEKFDPNFHEVIGEVGPSEALAKEAKSGVIIEEIQKGYTLNGKVIRVAKVRITK